MDAADPTAAANTLASSCDNLLRLAHGEQPRGCVGYSEDQRLKTAEQAWETLEKARSTHLPVIDAAANSLPNLIPAVLVGAAAGSSFHRAVARLACEIHSELLKAQAVATVTGLGKSFREWWPLAAAELAKRPMIDLGFVRESLRSESRSLTRPSSEPDQSADSTRPKPWLFGWHDITEALDMKYDRRGDIKSLNERFRGPISNSGQGTKPMVGRSELLDWWNNLAIKQQDMANQSEGRKLSGETQYNHGRHGRVAPEIGGGVKNRRRPKQT